MEPIYLEPQCTNRKPNAITFNHFLQYPTVDRILQSLNRILQNFEQNQWRISGPKFLYFHTIFWENWSNSSWATHRVGGSPSGKSWIRHWKFETRKSSCVNARGIPTAAYQILHMLSYPGGDTYLGQGG